MKHTKMNIKKKYWKWDEKFNDTKFKLGDDIQSLINDGIVFPYLEDSTMFYGENEIPWKIRTENGMIKSIFYRESFFFFYKEDIWDKDYDKFESVIDEVLTPADKNDKGDLFHVVFRGGFIAIAGIIRNNDPSSSKSDALR